ncbi:bifunctional aldolase/short-chain dehydrogenase [Ktedonosporobacter rubrisoli]|uniref:Bifunctional aldolase/short-chain dehydrogenase n=1 Tax=Ktedonosporobacter rubrisoli TaxID=2509675 RepID=A0A4P6K4F2_KTERU|nr:bifunctional aldolase/short-chain dehydrogenase [Ktedonosporobacter rubrisoli]QBD83109.1 bifunctional aldolase/short-chain dehydrogenase [Ktedonosporobacter rubrisoli]
MVANLWKHDAAEQASSGLEELVYRSNLLGKDRAVANWGGGNTSVKTVETDFRGRQVEVMWVKGSGSDLAGMQARHFTGLRLEDVRPLLERDEMTDEEMVSYLSHCMLDSKHPRPSIETLLHAFLPFAHIDHTHPDAIISLCSCEQGKEIAREIYGDRFVWVPYVRPGFALSKLIAEGVKNNPQAELVLMEKHGLVTWGETSEACYLQTIAIINEAQAYIEAQAQQTPLFGGEKYASLTPSERQDILAQVLPLVRGAVSDEQGMIVTYDDAEDVLTFVNSHNASELSQIGAACPDHLVHTKRVPLYIDWEPRSDNVSLLIEKLQAGIISFKDAYRAYFARNKNEGDKIANSAPRVILIPGLGMINTGRSWFMAQVSGALYHRAIAVMEGATKLGSFTSLSEKEAYDVEYWPLELYKLSLLPPEAEFSRKIGFITGGAGAIGRATAQRMVAEGMHVVLTDINLEGAQQVAQDINQKFGEGRALAVKVDVTDEEAVKNSVREAVLAYGGIDVVVNNAGLATSSPFEKTSLREWNLNINVLATGYFLVARETFALMKQQGLGGCLVFVSSKNGVYAGKNVAAYSASKAAEVHLARCIATEGGPYGIRVNTVLPDAILQGSSIWNSHWREERAAAYEIKPDELEEYYRKRTTLLVNVFPEDVAESIVFLASSKAAKTTGCMITVDGGIAAAFTR